MALTLHIFKDTLLFIYIFIIGSGYKLLNGRTITIYCVTLNGGGVKVEKSKSSAPAKTDCAGGALQWLL